MKRSIVHHSGNAMAEYGLIAGLVLLSSLGALLLLGGNTSQMFSSMLSHQQPVTAVTAASTTGLAGGITATDVSTSPNSSSMSIKLQDGSTIKLSNYPTDIAKSVNTTGTNGTTELLLASLASITQQLHDSGQLTPAQSNLLTQLANKGHQIAGIEGIVEQAIATSSNGQELANTTLQYNGESYSTLNLALLIGQTSVDNYNSTNSVTVTSQGTQIQAGPVMAEFYGLMSQVNNISGLDPVAKESVMVLANQIANLANGNQSATYALIGGTAMENYSSAVIELMNKENPNAGIIPDSLTGLSASTITHLDSAVICSTGTGTDSGAQCSP